MGGAPTYLSWSRPRSSCRYTIWVSASGSRGSLQSPRVTAECVRLQPAAEEHSVISNPVPFPFQKPRRAGCPQALPFLPLKSLFKPTSLFKPHCPTQQWLPSLQRPPTIGPSHSDPFPPFLPVSSQAFAHSRRFALPATLCLTPSLSPTLLPNSYSPPVTFKQHPLQKV